MIVDEITVGDVVDGVAVGIIVEGMIVDGITVGDVVDGKEVGIIVEGVIVDGIAVGDVGDNVGKYVGMGSPHTQWTVIDSDETLPPPPSK
jgi:hypothetical protein